LVAAHPHTPHPPHTAITQAKKKRDSAAVVDLYNSIVELEDPSELTPQIVAGEGGGVRLRVRQDPDVC
jgi:hypothetical protein